jgi:hypothetical protein
MDEMNSLFQQCIVSITQPSMLASSINRFVDRFLKEEMKSVLEQCNYWGSCYNPVARKKTTLLLGEYLAELP